MDLLIQEMMDALAMHADTSRISQTLPGTPMHRVTDQYSLKCWGRSDADNAGEPYVDCESEYDFTVKIPPIHLPPDQANWTCKLDFDSVPPQCFTAVVVSNEGVALAKLCMQVESTVLEFFPASLGAHLLDRITPPLLAFYDSARSLPRTAWRTDIDVRNFISASSEYEDLVQVPMKRGGRTIAQLKFGLITIAGSGAKPVFQSILSDIGSRLTAFNWPRAKAKLPDRLGEVRFHSMSDLQFYQLFGM